MRKAEQVLQGLHVALQGWLASATVQRNQPLPQRFPAAGLVTLFDGDPGEPEVTMSPLRYHYAHRAQIDVMTFGPSRDAGFDDICEAIGAGIDADRTLGGLCDWIEAEAPSPAEIPLDGVDPVKAGPITVTLHYTAPGPLT